MISWEAALGLLAMLAAAGLFVLAWWGLWCWVDEDGWSGSGTVQRVGILAAWLFWGSIVSAFLWRAVLPAATRLGAWLLGVFL